MSHVENKMEKMMKSKNFLKIILIITLIVNMALTIVNLYIVAQINQTLMTLGTFNGHLNTAFVMRAEASNLILEKPSIYIMEGENLKYTVHFGMLNVHIQAITPNFSVVTVKIKDFNVTKSKYLDPDRLSEIDISFAGEPREYVYVIAPGLNDLNSQIRIKAKIPLNSENLLSKGETIQFQLGSLFLEIELFNFETRNKTVTECSSQVFITIEPIS